MSRFVQCAVTSLLAIVFIVSMVPGQGKADTPYPNYYISPDHFQLKIPAPYVPDGYISLDNDEAGAFNKPQDLFIDRQDHLYIADTENKRVVKTDADGNVLLVIGAGGEAGGPGALAAPRGVFVDEEDGSIYVADSLSERIVQYDAEGGFLREVGKPSSPLLRDPFKYQPVKVIVDSRKYFYVVNSGDHKGLLMLDREGQFRGYFGGNRVEATWFDALIRFLYDQEQRAGAYINLPYSFNNVALAPDGYLYASTTGASAKQIRKFNMAGGDIYPGGRRDFTDPSLHGEDRTQNFVDVAIDRKGNMTILDQTFGRMYQYDVGGRALFAFGSNGQGVGNKLSGVAVEADAEGNLYVLDEMLNAVLKFRKTAFSATVHEANALYGEGKYEESFEPWQQVRDNNNFYELALQAMGQIEMRQDDYAEAMASFREAYDKDGFSEAYYEFRRQYVKEHFDIIASCTLIAFALLYLFFTFRNKIGGRLPERIERYWFLNPGIRLLRFLKYAYRVMLHPFLGYEELRYENKGKWSHAFLLIALYAVATSSKYWLTGFVYRPVPLQFVQWEFVVLQPILLWIIWSVVNYGIATITEGEGRWRDVFIATAYNFTPFIFFSIPLYALTHLLTWQEQQFVQLFETILVLWSAFLFFVSVRETHSYETGKAIGILGLTTVSCVVFVLLYMLVFGLGMNVIDFGRAIAREAFYVGN
ncbi:YIP1 family protein [Paenibacillus sp.]|uniref:YIP1 family protein n=1 Tax=Paenibacillus sp. TaxID=58172 RepID=UPI002811E4BD|nr:YIP1 family protein [Paenibacillus sp.]